MHEARSAAELSEIIIVTVSKLFTKTSNTVSEEVLVHDRPARLVVLVDKPVARAAASTVYHLVTVMLISFTYVM